jgi:hypothetical protein
VVDEGRLVVTMPERSPSKWLRIRAGLAVVVVALVIVELTGHRSRPVALIQGLCIVGIIITVGFDLWDIYKRRVTRPGPPG